MAPPFDSHRNLAVALVAVAPTPSLTGGTVTIKNVDGSAGAGALFPNPAVDGEFNVVLYPRGVEFTTPANAEIARCTARVGDVLALTRAQEGTSPMFVSAGWVIENVVSVKVFTDIEVEVPGPQGATGVTGATGATGVTGATGAASTVAGATGTTGATGVIGSAGATGVAGATGTTGTQGATGVTGATGAGATGATGVAGPAGATGVTGATGAGTVGATGAAGAAGATGATGTGATGVTGATGPAGPGTSLGTALPARIAQSTGLIHYVDSATGNDSRTAVQAQNPATPWAGVQKALDTVALGSIIEVMGDGIVYRPHGASLRAKRFVWDRAGSAGAVTTIRAYAGDTPILKSSVDGLGGETPFHVTGAGKFIRIGDLVGGVRRGFKITGAGYTLVSDNYSNVWFGSGVTDCELIGNDIYATYQGSNVYIDITAARIHLYSNLIHDAPFSTNSGIGYHGVYNQGDDVVIANNIVYSNSQFQIQSRGNSSVARAERVYIVNNVTADAVVQSGIAVEDTTYDHWLVNNISAFNTNRGLIGYDNLGLNPGDDPTNPDLAWNNVVYGNTGSNFYNSGAHIIDFTKLHTGDFTGPGDNQVSDPLFTNRAGGDYSVVVGSPAIGYGDAAYCPSFDFYGSTRVIVDAGAILATVTGTTGATGPIGATGVTGATGAGTTGATGATGAQGATGTTGAAGATGTTGAVGATGTAGAAGATGVTGGTGTAGAAGATGTTGAAGATGVTGATGTQGVVGATGVTGSTGATGTTGAAGATGTAGAAGATGTTGATGAGATGVTGATGAAGTTGATGATGIAGATGADGSTYAIHQVAHTLVVGDVVRYDGAAYVRAQADTASHAEVVGLVTVVAGVDDFTLTVVGRVTGLTGLTGGVVYFLDAATPGALTATEPVAVNQISKPLLIANTATSGYFFNMRGARIGAGAGATGITGATGAAGATGVTGATGAGVTGATGTSGTSGATGVAGATGGTVVVTAYASGTQTTVVGTEHFLSSPNVPGIFVFHIDLAPMLAGDVVELRVYQIVLTGGTTKPVFFQSYQGVQSPDDLIKLSDQIANELTDTNSLRFSIKQTFGSTRNFPWKLLKTG